MDILTGTEIVTALRDKHTELFGAFPNSYGTLGHQCGSGYPAEAVRRAQARAFSPGERSGRCDGPNHRDRRLRGHQLTTSTAWCSARTRATCVSACRRRRPVRSATTPARRSPPALLQHADCEKHDRLTINDYLWRWDTDGLLAFMGLGAKTRRSGPIWCGDTGAAASTGNSSATTNGSISLTASRQWVADHWSKTSRCRSDGPPSSSTGSWHWTSD